MKKIAIINLKGGVGKTTTTANFGLCLAREAYKVLVIDCDKQGNLSSLFKCQTNKTLTEVLSGVCCAEKAIIGKGTFYPDIIPTNINLLAANQELQEPDRLKKVLEPLERKYDYCLLDCPPNIDMITLNVLTCADEVIIPVRLDGFVKDGIKDVLEQVDSIRAINPKIKFKGCLVTSYRKNTEDILKDLERSYKVFDAKIPYSPKVAEASVAKELLDDFSYRSGAARGYRNFTEEYLEYDI